MYSSKRRDFEKFWEKYKPQNNSNNDITLNNHDPRRKETSKKVDYLNYKIGESSHIENRKQFYFKILGNKIFFLT